MPRAVVITKAGPRPGQLCQRADGSAGRVRGKGSALYLPTANGLVGLLSQNQYDYRGRHPHRPSAGRHLHRGNSGEHRGGLIEGSSRSRRTSR